MMTTELERIKDEIISALSHLEAEDGLYFRNLITVHEEEERPVVTGAEEDVLDALAEMIRIGIVETDETGKEIIFKLRRN